MSMADHRLRETRAASSTSCSPSKHRTRRRQLEPPGVILSPAASSEAHTAFRRLTLRRPMPRQAKAVCSGPVEQAPVVPMGAGHAPGHREWCRRGCNGLVVPCGWWCVSDRVQRVRAAVGLTMPGQDIGMQIGQPKMRSAERNLSDENYRLAYIALG